MKKTTITIDGVEFVRKDSITPVDGLKYVVVRTYSAGVHAGFLVSRKHKEVTLAQSRRLWYWDGAFTLSAVAMDGVQKPEKCKFSVEVDSIILTEAIEIIDVSDKARENLKGVKSHG